MLVWFNIFKYPPQQDMHYNNHGNIYKMVENPVPKLISYIYTRVAYPKIEVATSPLKLS